MPIPSWSATCSDVPFRAPCDYRALPARVRVREDATWAVRGVWHGSGFLVRELPEAHRYHEDEARHCASCQSEDTLCIYLLADPGQFSITIEIELVCKACSAYTLWEGSD